MSKIIQIKDFLNDIQEDSTEIKQILFCAKCEEEINDYYDKEREICGFCATHIECKKCGEMLLKESLIDGLCSICYTEEYEEFSEMDRG